MKQKRRLAFVMAAALALGALGGGAVAIPGAGESGYVSLHKYVTTTDIPNVFKVSLQVQGQLDPPTIGVFLMVDQSGSMGSRPAEGGVSIGTESKISMTTAAVKEALDIFFDPAVNPAYESTYIGMAYYTNMKAGWVAGAVNTGPSHITGMTTDQIYTNVPYNNSPAGDFPHYNWVAGSAGYALGGGGITSWSTAPARVAANVPVWDSTMENAWAAQNQTTQPMVNHTEKVNLENFANEVFVAGSNWYNMGAPKLSYASSRTEVLPHVYNWLANPGAATGGKATHFDKVYVIVMSDGTDDGITLSGDSTNFFQAIKGDPAVNYFHQRLSGPQYYGQTAQQTLIGPGLDGEVMGISLGLASGGFSNPNWASDLIVSGVAIGSGTGTGPVDIEQAGTIYNAAITKDSAGVWHDNPGGFLGTSLASAGANSVEAWFKNPSNIIVDGSGGIESNYIHTTDKAGIVNAYRHYANQIIGDIGTDIYVADQIGNFYTLYQYPGEPLLKPIDANKRTGSGVWSAGTASASGNSIRWDIPAIPSDGATIMLEYYVELDSSVDPSMHYAVNDFAYISYTDSSGNRVQTYFPVPYASLSGDTKTEPAPGGAVSPGDSQQDTSGGTGMMPLFAIPYGEQKVYTPSVTPTKTMANDALQEKPAIESETIADAGEEVAIANTATTSNAPALAVIGVALAGLGLLLVARKRRVREEE